MPSSIRMVAALYLVLPTLALGASIPPRPRGWWGSEATATESSTAAAASGTPVPAANVTLDGVSNAIVNSSETESMLENANTTVVADINADSVNITDLLQGYDLALLAYPNGTAYIVDENAQVACTGVDECKAYLETVGVEEISCDGDDDDEDDDDEDCEYTDGQEIPETPETPENPNGADGSDSADTPDTSDSLDTPDSPDYGNAGNSGSGSAWQSSTASSGSAPAATSKIGQNAVATGGNLNLAVSKTADVAGSPTASATADADAQCDVSLRDIALLPRAALLIFLFLL